ncbi:MAG TPA: hypothetical protein VGK97_12645 [Spongiibacteraceae bacterium]|jgi:hypothetical protein
MEHPDSKDAFDEKAAGSSADNSESASETTTTRPTAIERQIAAVSGLGHGKQTHREAPGHTTDRYILDYNTRRRKPRRFGLMSFFVLLLLVAAGLALVFTDLGPLQKAVGTIPQVAGQVVRDGDSLPATHASPTSPSSTTNPSPASASQTIAPKKVAEVATPNAISIPIADVSLRNPELLEQLVQVYRSQLATDPNNSAARTALNQLQERSLSELQTIVLEGDDATAVKSLEIVSRLFPEVADSARYKYLAARTDRVHRPVKDEPAAKPENSTPATTATSPAAAPSTTASSTTTPPTTISSKKRVSTPTDSSAAVAKNNTENASSSKPEIRSVSITPGTMMDNRFVPSDGGNVFMVEISYRNFDKAFVEKDEATLVTLLGVPGDSMVLAEVPVTISADRGTKSFAMETTNVQGYTGGKFQLNFLVNDTFLTSRTLRLSRPGQ